MANKVTGQVIGGQAKTFDESTKSKTVRDVLQAMGLSESYQATVNGDAATLDTALSDYDFVSFSEKVKGAKKPKTILRKAKK